MIIIQEYNPAWPVEFEALRSSLQEILGPLSLRIDHIGSTSIPGLGAKDVIDIQASVRELDPEIIRRLVAAGYRYLEKFNRDHVPLGADPDPRLWEKFLFNEAAGQRRINLHVRVLGNPNQRYPLLFRDYLRAHPNSARSIELIKRQLARHLGEEIEAYYDIKDPVYDLVWEAAQNWATSIGWEPAD